MFRLATAAAVLTLAAAATPVQAADAKLQAAVAGAQRAPENKARDASPGLGRIFLAFTRIKRVAAAPKQIWRVDSLTCNCCADACVSLPSSSLLSVTSSKRILRRCRL